MYRASETGYQNIRSLHPGTIEDVRQQDKDPLLSIIWMITGLIMLITCCITVSIMVLISFATGIFSYPDKMQPVDRSSGIWQAPDSACLPPGAEGARIRYGRELISHTAAYFGPKGSVRASSNGMNCQNCHLNAGTKPFGNNFGAAANNYPRWRGRSGEVESLERRINDCFERSLNGERIDPSGREMKAMIAYIQWVGKDTPKDDKRTGFGIPKLAFQERPADPVKGKEVYIKYCFQCHGHNGMGKLNPDGKEYLYPPLAGPGSYNTGAGLYRLSSFAGFVKANMPYGVTYEDPLLTDEEAWDVAAYINSLPRPEKTFPSDWPDISKKPFDHPFGPYADTFPERQHKYGPFGPIIKKDR